MATTSARIIHRLVVLSCVSYMASHAAAVSFNYSSCGPALSRHDTSFAGNNTVAGRIFGVLALDDRCSSRALPRVSGVSSLAIRRGSAITRHVILTTTDPVDSSIDGSLTLVERPQPSNWSAELLSPISPLSQEQIRGLVSELSRYTFDACSGSPVGSLEPQGHQNTWWNGIVYHIRPYTHSGQHFEWPSNWLPHEPARMRKLLSGTHGHGCSTRARHAATRWQVQSSWLKPASVAASALVGLICAVAGFVLCCIRSRRPLQSTAANELEDDDQTVAEPKLRRGLGPWEFVHGELAAATDNFAEERKIGRGGFGPVYRGYLREQGRHVAIKALSQEQPVQVQGLREFQAEVSIMSQLRHRNIVRLVGWCRRRRQLALVYELMPGGSLDAHLYDPDRHLTWSHRYKIALQLGSALRYLHADCEQCVVHGDIKPENVMLDASLDAKLGDFGLARLVDHGAEPRTTQVVAGTVGYIDPEFVTSRRPSAESDVYSFGVVLLEIACGRRPTRRSDQVASAALLLLASVRDVYRRNAILDAADRRLDGEFDRMQMERMLVTGLWCAHRDPAQRPSVAQAVDVLRSENAELPVLGTMGGSGEIRALEGQAYADFSAEISSRFHESTETAYLTTLSV